MIVESSGGITVGGYYSSFSESPFGSFLTLRNNTVRHAGLGHRTAFGTQWGAGSGGIGLAGSSRRAPNATTLHHNVTIVQNTITPLREQPALSARATSGLVLKSNKWCTWTKANEVSHCVDVENVGNDCCDQDCLRCQPC